MAGDDGLCNRNCSHYFNPYFMKKEDHRVTYKSNGKSSHKDYVL